MHRSWPAALVVATSILAGTASTGAQTPSIDWLTIGNPRNAPDKSGFYGEVGYVYQIAKHEVTNAQYVECLNFNAVLDDLYSLYNFEMATDPHGGIVQIGSGTPADPFVYETRPNFADKPLNYVSWYDCMRFTNWLHNGGGFGDTETGAYTTFGQLQPIGARRNPGALIFLPTVNEWHKAAYHDPSQTRRYRWYSSGNTRPTRATANSVGDINNPGPNVANYDQVANWNGSAIGNVTTVGSAGPESESYYGTADQTGNLWEWNEWWRGTGWRGKAGGSFVESASAQGSWSIAGSAAATIEVFSFGFRPARAVACQADLDGSGIVDLADLGLLLANWGCTGVYCVGDIDRNEETDLADLGMMLTQFGCSQ